MSFFREALQPWLDTKTNFTKNPKKGAYLKLLETTLVQADVLSFYNHPHFGTEDGTETWFAIEKLQAGLAMARYAVPLFNFNKVKTSDGITVGDKNGKLQVEMLMLGHAAYKEFGGKRYDSFPALFQKVAKTMLASTAQVGLIAEAEITRSANQIGKAIRTVRREYDPK